MMTLCFNLGKYFVKIDQELLFRQGFLPGYCAMSMILLFWPVYVLFKPFFNHFIKDCILFPLLVGVNSLNQKFSIC